MGETSALLVSLFREFRKDGNFMHSLRLPIIGIAVFFALLLCVVISLGNGNVAASASISSPPPVPGAHSFREPPGAPAIPPTYNQTVLARLLLQPIPRMMFANMSTSMDL
jgi:hypothetical protein